LLPEEIVLFEPSPDELFADDGQPSRGIPATRLIFLNTPLTGFEVASLASFRQEWLRQNQKHSAGDFAATGEHETDDLPEFVRLNALRILQHTKFDVLKSVRLVLTCLEERVKRLPLSESSMMDDLSLGALYWHGRDRKCRPCLVVRIERMSELIKDKERCVKLVIYVLEYAIRFAMVPGRVENWVVLVDFKNASEVVSLYKLPSMCLTAKAIAQTLECVYCCRMVWVKLLNLPGVLSKVVQSVIPTEKRKKVGVVEDPRRELLEFFEPNQLEERYGGSQPDLDQHETYPFRFFPNAKGAGHDLDQVSCCSSSRSTAASSAAESEASDLSSPGSPHKRSLHTLTSRVFHEGQLWDTTVGSSWMQQALCSSLTPEAAEALSASSGTRVEACRSLPHWLELVGSAESIPDTNLQTVETELTNGLKPDGGCQSSARKKRLISL